MELLPLSTLVYFNIMNIITRFSLRLSFFYKSSYTLQLIEIQSIKSDRR